MKGIAKKVKIVEQYMLQKQQIENGTEQQHFEQKQLYTLINICEVILTLKNKTNFFKI